MRKPLRQLKLSLLGAALALLVVSGSAAFALPSQANAHAEGANTPTGTTTTTTGKPTDPGSQGATRLATAQLKVCQNRQTAINNILTKIVTRGDNQLNLFNTIAQRVETFKTSKNLTLSNYDTLVATLQTDQTNATNDLAAMKTNGTLDCTGSDPKGMVSAFQASLKTEITDLQKYRTDVKNLIVAVKTAVDSSTTGGNQ